MRLQREKQSAGGSKNGRGEVEQLSLCKGVKLKGDGEKKSGAVSDSVLGNQTKGGLTTRKCQNVGEKEREVGEAAAPAVGRGVSWGVGDQSGLGMNRAEIKKKESGVQGHPRCINWRCLVERTQRDNNKERGCSLDPHSKKRDEAGNGTWKGGFEHSGT